MKIYIIRAISGVGSNRREWLLKAFDSRMNAEWFLKELERARIEFCDKAAEMEDNVYAALHLDAVSEHPELAPILDKSSERLFEQSKWHALDPEFGYPHMDDPEYDVLEIELNQQVKQFHPFIAPADYIVQTEKKKEKIITVRSCRNCPYRKMPENSCLAYCYAVKGPDPNGARIGESMKLYAGMIDIPDWCPLEEAK